jgi:hypothetical protein
MVTDEQLREWRIATEDASRQPWEWDAENWRLSTGDSTLLMSNEFDGKFAVAAREAMPLLVAEVERLRKIETAAIDLWNDRGGDHRYAYSRLSWVLIEQDREGELNHEGTRRVIEAVKP